MWTGVHSGPVDLTVEVWDRPAPDVQTTTTTPDGWEEVAEGSARSPTGLATIALSDDFPDELDDVPLPTEWMRVRACARGRATHPDQSVSHVVEQYLLQLWPAAPAPLVALTPLLH